MKMSPLFFKFSGADLVWGSETCWVTGGCREEMRNDIQRVFTLLPSFAMAFISIYPKCFSEVNIQSFMHAAFTEYLRVYCVPRGCVVVAEVLEFK